MLVDIVEARPLVGYRVHLRFEGGLETDLDLGGLIRFEEVFAPLRDPARFGELRVYPELGTVYRPGGADLAPDVLYARATGKPIDVGHSG
jgi:hypothetical protein